MLRLDCSHHLQCQLSNYGAPKSQSKTRQDYIKKAVRSYKRIRMLLGTAGQGFFFFSPPKMRIKTTKTVTSSDFTLFLFDYQVYITPALFTSQLFHVSQLETWKVAYEEYLKKQCSLSLAKRRLSGDLIYIPTSKRQPQRR